MVLEEEYSVTLPISEQYDRVNHPLTLFLQSIRDVISAKGYTFSFHY